MQVYLDYSATTPCRPEAQQAMMAVLTQQWGNPSSLHEWGQRAATVLEQARMQVASLIHAPGDAIVFTSGGTEANNLAIFGVTHRYHQPQHLIISSVEHSAIAEPVHFLESQGWQVTRLPVDRLGRVDPAALAAALRPNTVLVSVIYGQSEVGTLQPIATLGNIARTHGALFHTDAVQAAGRLPLDVRHLPVDLVSLSSHKLYGPQGVGALYLRPGVQLSPLLFGGGQEMKLRSGTQALPTIAGFGMAAELAAAELEQETARLLMLRQRLFTQLTTIPGLQPTGDWQDRLPHHLSFTVATPVGTPLSGKTLVRQLNLAGIGISAGAACASGKLTPSPILKAMGYDDLTAQSGIRLTLGRDTSLTDVDWTVEVLRQVLARLSPAAVLSGV
jgi:cysteine desulfurase